MKASERLRELDGAMTPREQWSCWIPNDAYESHGILERRVEWAICDLRNALPLIADVVEAAERPSTWARQTPEMRAAVTALRDALQPEPPGWGADRRCPETCG